MTEAEIQREILALFGSLPGVLCERMNTGAAAVGDRLIRFGLPGAPDIRLTVGGRSAAIEVKSATGRQSEAQKRWQRAFEAAGGVYVLARSTQDAIAGILSLTTGTAADRLTAAASRR